MYFGDDDAIYQYDVIILFENDVIATDIKSAGIEFAESVIFQTYSTICILPLVLLHVAPFAYKNFPLFANSDRVTI